MHRRFRLVLLICLAVPAWGQLQLPHLPAKLRFHRRRAHAAVLPLTTKSLKARAAYLEALTDFENLKTDQAMDGWRKAAKIDPRFALAHVQLAFNSKDPAEQSTELTKAKALARRVSPSERLFIRWVTGVRENNYVAGIQAMNDLVAAYPKDKHLMYYVGNWLVWQESYDQARKFMERALAMDPNYPPALNDLGYSYALTYDYPHAFAAMERYVAALPKEPNPNDSYGELLRMSGDFEAALQHYQAALKIDPKFVYSQIGIADTYALMGDEDRARQEYAKAIAQAGTEVDRVEFGIQAAMTWLRQKKYSKADAAFESLIEEAHAAGLELHEAQIHRMMALYQPDDAASLKQLEQADAVLDGDENIPKSDRDEERARVLRWRATRASHMGNNDVANKALEQLQALSDSSSSHVIRHAYHAAVGAVLMGNNAYAEAITHLAEDHDNAFSMKLLAEAYMRSGATEEANNEIKKLTSMNLPTIDQALAVLPARERLALNPANPATAVCPTVPDNPLQPK